MFVLPIFPDSFVFICYFMRKKKKRVGVDFYLFHFSFHTSIFSKSSRNRISFNLTPLAFCVWGKFFE